MNIAETVTPMRCGCALTAGTAHDLQLCLHSCRYNVQYSSCVIAIGVE